MKTKQKIKRLMIDMEYDVQGRYAILESVEGSEAVCRDRFGNQFRVNINDVIEKKFKNK